jgi:hypothetical protein
VAAGDHEGGGGSIGPHLRETSGGGGIGAHVVTELALWLSGEEASHSRGGIRHVVQLIHIWTIGIVQSNHGDGTTRGRRTGAASDTSKEFHREIGKVVEVRVVGAVGVVARTVVMHPGHVGTVKSGVGTECRRQRCITIDKRTDDSGRGGFQQGTLNHGDVGTHCRMSANRGGGGG